MKNNSSIKSRIAAIAWCVSLLLCIMFIVLFIARGSISIPVSIINAALGIEAFAILLVLVLDEK